MSSDKLVEARRLSFAIARGKNSLPILNEIDLTFEEGDFLAIQGPSGSGKSTLLHVLGTLLRPTGGELFINGIDPFKLSDLQLAEFRCHEVGFIFQQFHVFPNLTLLENILIPTWLPFESAQSDPGAEKRARDLAARLGISTRLDHYPHQLSGGQLQRLVIARALMRRPRILFADEPTGNLDSKNAAETLKIFQKLNEEFGQSIFLVTHDAGIAAEASRKVYMVDGQIESDERFKPRVARKLIPQVTAVSQPLADDAVGTAPVAPSETPQKERGLASFAAQNLKKNWRRSSLTMLGIFIGIACTYFLGTLGSFVQEKVIESYRDLGVSAFRFHAYPNWMGYSSKKSSVAYSQMSFRGDIAPLRRVFPEIENFSPIYISWQGGRLIYGGKGIEQNTRIYGVSRDFFDISGWPTSEGKVFNRYQEKSGSDVCVIGHAIKKKLFAHGSAEGALLEVHMENKRSVCRVTGVLEDRKFGAQWDDPNEIMYVPYTNMANYMTEPPRFMNFLAKVEDGVDTSLVATSVENLFKKKYGGSGDFRADRNSMLLAQMQKFTRLMRFFLFCIAVVCLVMGGVGLMNMMLVSVSERLAELGLMQALGASIRSLKKGVVLEALILCAFAGSTGVVAAFGGFHLLLWITSKFLPQISFQWHFDAISLILALGAIFVVAMASAILPARKAAELEVAHTLKGR